MTHPRVAATAGFMPLFSAVMLPLFLAALDQGILAAAMPRIASDLGRMQETIWVTVGYLVAAVIAAPIYGRLGDRHGHRPMLLVALGVFAGGSVVCATAPGMSTLIAGRVVQGFGGGGLMVLSQALIGHVIAPADRPRYQGWFTLVFTVASLAGPAIGGLVTGHAGWRWLFVANVPLAGLAAQRVFALRMTGGPRVARPLDPVGLALFAATTVVGLLWLSAIGRRLGPQPSDALLLLVVPAIVLGAVLWRHQRRHRSPFLPVEILRHRGGPWLCATIGSYGAAMLTLMFLLPIHWQMSWSLSAASAGVHLIPLTLGVVVGSFAASRHAHATKQAMRLSSTGLALAGAALAAIAVISPSPTWASLLLGLCGIGLGTVMSAAQLALQVVLGAGQLGAAASVASLARSIGGAVSTAALGSLAFALLPTASGFQMAFGLLACVLWAGAWAASRIPPVALEPSASETGAQIAASS